GRAAGVRCASTGGWPERAPGKPGVLVRDFVSDVKRLVDELDPVLHERGRLAIVSVLAAAPRLTFTELRDTLEMTDGNLSIHLQKLEERRFIHLHNHFVGRRPPPTSSLPPPPNTP